MKDRRGKFIEEADADGAGVATAAPPIFAASLGHSIAGAPERAFCADSMVVGLERTVTVEFRYGGFMHRVSVDLQSGAYDARRVVGEELHAVYPDSRYKRVVVDSRQVLLDALALLPEEPPEERPARQNKARGQYRTSRRNRTADPNDYEE